LFLRFFHIVLIATYFFCGYSQIARTGYIYTLKEIVFTPSKNNTPTRTQFFSASLPKHIHTLNQIEVGDHAKDICLNIKFNRTLIALYNIPSEKNLLKIPLDSPKNKAPPFSSL
jgi:hypothetical protein